MGRPKPAHFILFKMLKKKKNRRKDGQRGSLITILIFLMVLILFWLSWGFIQQLWTAGEDSPAETLQPFPLRITSPAEFSSQSRRFERDAVPNPELLEGLFPGAFTLLVDGEDINEDGNLNFLLVTELSHTAPAELADLGYGFIITEAQLLSQQPDGTLSLLLGITADAISGTDGSPLLAQVPATFGYGFNLSRYTGPPYAAEVMLFELVILGEDLLPASDDLTIYWHPDRSSYAATNAFGSPGTF